MMSKIMKALKYFFTEMPDNKDEVLLDTAGKNIYLYL